MQATWETVIFLLVYQCVSMVGAGIAGSLITSALSELASVSAHTIFDKIKDRISADDKELLEEEVISSLKNDLREMRFHPQISKRFSILLMSMS